MNDIRAISLWQPWAFLIAIGAKCYETRSWQTAYRGRMAIHASQHWGVRMGVQCYQEPFFTILSRAGIRFPARYDRWTNTGLGLDFGAVLAVAELVDIVPAATLLPQLGPQEIAFGDFTHGRFAWRYENVRPLVEPFPCTGRQGLFNVSIPAELLAV